MNKPTAIIDKSLLQRLWDSNEKTKAHMATIQQKVQLIAPLVLFEETLANRVLTPKGKNESVFSEMHEYLKEIQPLWMDDLMEISFRELVLGESLDLVPWLSLSGQRLLFDFQPNDPSALAWAAKRRDGRKNQLLKRIAWQKARIQPGKFFLQRDEKTFLQMGYSGIFMAELG